MAENLIQGQEYIAVAGCELAGLARDARGRLRTGGCNKWRRPHWFM